MKLLSSSNFKNMYLVICLLVFVCFLMWYATNPFYWKKKNLPYLIPLPIFGNVLPLITYGVSSYFQALYKKFPGKKYYGMHFLTRPALFIKDTEIIQNILVKDFDYFTSQGFYTNQERDPCGASLFLLKGQQWKEMRGILNQYFTPAKVKAMLSYADSTIEKLTEALDKKIAQDKPFEIHESILDSTNDITMKAFFGLETDIFTNENSIFRNISERILTITLTIKMFIGLMSSRLYDFFKLTFFEKEVNIFLADFVTETIDYRRKNNIYRQDFLQGMIELLDKEQTDERKYFPDNTPVNVFNLDTVVAQGITMYVAASKATALLQAFLIYEMALNPEIQTKCRNEVNSVADNEPLSVEQLSKLPYLTAAIQETMRLYAPLHMISRECTKEYTFPDNNLVIEPGTLILIPLASIHMDENYFPEPMVFRPERFLDEEKNNLTPGSYFPLGLGPRTCIAMNFGLSQMKLILGRLLQQYEFHVCSKTEVPLKFTKYCMELRPVNGIWLKLESLQVSKKK